MRVFHLLLFVIVGLLITSCGSVKPEAPEIIVQEIDIPEQPVSTIKVPIKVNLAPYFDETNKELDKEFRGGEKQCSGVSYQYYFKRAPISFEGRGKFLAFNVDGQYKVKLNYCPECTHLIRSEGTCLLPRLYAKCGYDEGMRKMNVGFKSTISITDNYRLTSNTKLDHVKAITPCKVTLFKYNATKTLEKEVTKAMKYVQKEIDNGIKSVDLKPDMAVTWKALSDPIDLEGYGFMYLKPTAVGINDLRYWGDTAYFNAHLHALPKIYLDESGEKPKPLPNLTDIEEKDGFDIHMDISASYDSLSSILTNNVKGTSMDIKGREVIFDEVEVYGAANHQLTIKVAFSGKKSGILFLTGTPTFDKETQQISFPDMEFDIKTKSALYKSAKWLFDKKVTDMIRKSAAMDLKPYLDELKVSLHESLNGEIDEGVYMSGDVDEIIIDLIYPREDNLFIRIHSLGQLAIQM